MVRPPTQLRALLATTLFLLLPVAAVLAALVAMGRLAGGDAILALVVVGLALAAFVRPHVQGIARLTAHLDALAEGRTDAQPSPVWPPLVVALASAIGRLRRRWQQRGDALAARIKALDAVLDGLPDPLIMLDNHLRILRANAAALELLGDAPVGRELSAALRAPALLEAAQHALRREGGSRVEFELAGAVKRSLVGRVERLSGSASDEVTLIVVLHDVTAEKRTERMRADFVANASHELRTPLAALLGFIETLQGRASDDAAARARFLAIMQSQAGRMSRLVDDLLSLNRIELREHTAPTHAVDVTRVLRGVVDAMQPLSKMRAVAIAVELPEGEPPDVLGDGDELAQVFQNLIDNALKYGRRGTAVRIAARGVDSCPVPIGRMPAGGLVAIAVADEGEGIAADQIPRLTERFYRVNPARSRELGGTGLGLAIVKHIVNRHRGALKIESALGRGSTFTIYLPVAAATRKAEGEVESASRPGHGTVISPS